MTKTKKIYKARKESRGIKDEDAQVYGCRIEELMDKRNGKLTPKDVVEDGKNKTSPFNSYFEWDNTKAGEKYRLHQARYLLASIVTITIVENTPMEQRGFFSVKNGNNTPVYVTLDTAIKEEPYRNQIIDKITNHLENTVVLLKMFKQSC